MWQSTPFAIPLLIAAVTSLVVAGYVGLYGYRHSADATILSVVAMLLFAAVWATAYAFQLASVTTPAKSLLNVLASISSQGTAVAWLGFVLAYTGRGDWLVPRRFGPVLALFALTGVLELLNPATGWLKTYSVGSNGSLEVLQLSLRPAGQAVEAVYLVLIGVGVYLLFRHITGSQEIYRGQALALAATPVLPTAAYVVHLLGLGPYPNVNLAPVGFVAASVLMAYAILRYRFLELMPVVRDTVVETMDEGYVVLEGETVIDHNPAAAQLLDCGSAPLGQSIDSLFRGGLAAESLPEVGTAEYEHLVDSATGPRHLSVRASVLPDDRADHLLLLRDVTERRRIEQRYQALIEHASDLTAIVDADGTMSYVSPSVERILGYDPDRLTGKPATASVFEADTGTVEAAFQAVLSDDGAAERIECRVEDAGGESRVLEAVLRDLRDEPAVQGVVLNAWEVTERKRRAEKLEVLNRALRHDIRNEMQLVDGSSRLLEDHVDPAGQDHLDRLQTSAEQVVDLTATVRDLMTTMTDESVDLTPVEFVPILEREVERLSPPDGGTLRIEGSLPNCTVLANEMLSSVFRNLLKNGFQHNDSDSPTVTVSARRTPTLPESRPSDVTSLATSDGGGDDTDGYVEVRVADDGPGVDPERRDVVFGRGEQGVDSEGTGIGLYLVRTLVENYGGAVWIEDNDPRGAVFVVLLQVVEA